NGADNHAYLLPNVDQRLLAIDAAAALQRGPSGLGLALLAAGPTGPLGPGTLARPARNYAALAGKNIFVGFPSAKERTGEEVEVSPFVYLTDITATPQKQEAWL